LQQFTVINIRPNDNNTSNEIQDAKIRAEYEKLTKYFFSEMAVTFCEEALKRRSEVDSEKVKPYIKNCLNKLPGILMNGDKEKISEDALMYSTIFQNYVLYSDR